MTAPLEPLVSVIMAVRNEQGHIARSLQAVLEQDYPPHKLEILVADGMSNDNTRKLLEAAAERAANITLLENPGRTVAKGLNAALARARGEFVVRVDGHTEIEPDYVRQCIAALRRTGADCVGGRMDPISNTPFGAAIALATSSPFGVGGARFHYSRREEFVDTVYLGAWHRRLFNELGGFDEEQAKNQDDEFSYRLRARDGRILLCPAINSRYHARGSLRQLITQYSQYGYWKVRVMQKHPRQMRPRQFAPPLLVAGLLASLATSPVSHLGARAFVLLAGAYLAANLTASLLAGRRQPWRVRVRLPLAFAGIHGAYGCGFIVGLVAFWNRWTRGNSSIPLQHGPPLAPPLDAKGPQPHAAWPAAPHTPSTPKEP